MHWIFSGRHEINEIEKKECATRELMLNSNS